MPMSVTDLGCHHLIVKNENTSLQKLSLALPELSDEILESKAIILPSHGTEDSFYSGTLDFLDYLNENGLKTAIYATDESYIELSLHGADHWLGKLLVNSTIVTILINLLSSYIYDELKAEQNDNIAINVVVEKKAGDSVSIDFRGTVEELGAALDEIKKFSEVGSEDLEVIDIEEKNNEKQ